MSSTFDSDPAMLYHKNGKRVYHLYSGLDTLKVNGRTVEVTSLQIREAKIHGHMMATYGKDTPLLRLMNGVNRY